MADDACARKLEELRQYIPFLENMIVQLRDPKWKNREAQLNKMECLHSMITDQKKKLKLDTLKKCEDVILKLHGKVKQPEKSLAKDFSDHDLLNNLKLKVARAKLNELTPASPSPPRVLSPPRHKPIVIPTEKLSVSAPLISRKAPPDPDEFHVRNWDNTFKPKNPIELDAGKVQNKQFGDRYRRDKPNIYRSAAESLANISGDNKVPTVFDRLGTKPLLTKADLELLQYPEEPETRESDNLSLNELEDLRKKLKRELSKKEKKDYAGIKDLREILNKDANKSNSKPPEPVEPVTPKPKSPRVERVIKDPDSIFGSLLSSIDNQILGDGAVNKKKEKLHVTSTIDEKKSKSDVAKKDENDKNEKSCSVRPAKDDRKDKERSSKTKESSSRSEKDKSSHSSKDKEKEKDRVREKDKEKEKDRGREKDKEKDKSKAKDKHREPKKDKIVEKDASKRDSSKSRSSRSEKHSSSSGSTKSNVKETGESSASKVPKSNADHQEKSLPKHGRSAEKHLGSQGTVVAYKRLADKYNPKPRKPAAEADVDREVLDIIQKRIDSEPKIPFLDNIATEQPVSKNPPLMNELASLDPRIKNSGRGLLSSPLIDNFNKPLMNEFAPMKPPGVNLENINHLGSLLSDSNALLLSSVVSQFRGNTTQPPFHSPGGMTPKDTFLSPNINVNNNMRPFGMQFPQHNQSRNMHLGHLQNAFSQQNQLNMPAHVPNPGTFMNTFIVQQNNVNPNQYGNIPAMNNTFNNSFPPKKFFNPYEPIDDSANEYDLAKVQPVDFYTNPNQKKQLLSPPNYQRFENNHGREQFQNNRNSSISKGSYSNNRFQRDERFGPREREDRVDRVVPPVNKVERSGQIWNRDEQHGDPRLNNKDPRSRSREVRPLDNRNTQKSDVSDRYRSPQNREDQLQRSKYDRMYSKFDKRSGAQEKEETFASPLDSLYSTGSDSKITGKGYGIQKFKIPKKKAEVTEIDDNAKDVKQDVSKDQKPAKEVAHDLTDDKSKSEPDVKSSVKLNVEKKHDEVTSTQFDDETKPAEPIKSEIKQAETPAEVSSTDDSRASTTEQTLLTQFLTNLVANSDKKNVLMSLFNSLADGLGEQQKKKFKRIQRIVESDSSSGDESTSKVDTKASSTTEAVCEKSELVEVVTPEVVAKQPEKIEEVSDKEVCVPVKEDVQTPVPIKPKPCRRRRRRKKGSLARVDAETEQTEIPEEVDYDHIIESVGERIKSRKRNTKPDSVNPPKIRRYKTELDLLHEDIKEMFIRDGVLTATGKRMCRILKADPNALAPGESRPGLRKRAESNDDDEIPLNLRQKKANKKYVEPEVGSPKRRASDSNPRVLLEKTDLSKLVAPKGVDDTLTTTDDELDQLAETKSSRGGPNKKVTDPTATESDAPEENEPSEGESSASPLRRKGLKRSVKNKTSYEEKSDDEVVPASTAESDVAKGLKRSAKNKVSYEEKSDDEIVPAPTVESDVPQELKTNSKNTSYEEKLSDDEVAPAPTAEPEEATAQTHKKKVSKRRNNWAAGVIRKFKKKVKCPTEPVEEQEDSGHEESSSEDAKNTSHEVSSESKSDSNEATIITPDKHYYFDPKDKSYCKLCSFKGKMIIQHYKSAHPKDEVHISRISPEDAQKAIEESKERGFESVMASDSWVAKNRRQKYNFQCRFCHVFFKNENSENFYDHVTGHTGEYRFSCTTCSFKTANVKSLRAHLNGSHSLSSESSAIKPSHPPPPNFHMVFGHLCGECNYVQMQRDLVEEHAKIYHLTSTPQIHKINMSLIAPPEPAAKSHQHSDDELDTAAELVVEDEKDAAVPEDTSEDIETTENTKEIQPSDPVIDDEVPAKPAEKDRECDLNVFTCNTDITEQEQRIEEERLKKMKEVSETIKQARSSLSLTDKLKSRLENTVAAEKDQEELENSSPIEKTCCVSNEDKKVPPKVVSAFKPDQDEASKSVKAADRVSETPIISKNNAPISSIIQRLQGKLKTEIAKTDLSNPPPLTHLSDLDLNKPPPLTHLNDLNIKGSASSEDIVVRIGPIEARRKKDSVLFSCFAPTCVFDTEIQGKFEAHCNISHRICSLSMNCDLCQLPLGEKISDIFKHLIQAHGDTLQLSKAVVVAPKPMLRMRRLSGDILSEKRDGSPEIQTSEESVFPFEISDVITEGPESEDRGAPGFPFEIADVMSLSCETEQCSNAFPFTIANACTLTPELEMALNSPTGAIVVTNTSPPALSPLSSAGVAVKAADTPVMTVPVIQSVQSLAPALIMPVTLTNLSPSLSVCTSAPSPKLKTNAAPSSTVPPQRKPPYKKILLKDVPLQPHELQKQRKSVFTLGSMLQPLKLAHLYKCPEFSCSFSCDAKKVFENHLLYHTDLQDGRLVPCLYCNFKTQFEHISVHIDLRHGRCQYGCAYCFYRAVCQSYVQIHHKMEHISKPLKVLKLPLNPEAQLTKGHVNPPLLKNNFPAYICGQRGCGVKLLFRFSFNDHLVTKHRDEMYTCIHCPFKSDKSVKLADHMATHGIHKFHCRYCSFGSDVLDELYKHHALIHFSSPTDIVIREFVPDFTARTPKEYNHEGDEIFDRLKRIEVPDSISRFLDPKCLIIVNPPKKKTKTPAKANVKSTQLPYTCTILNPMENAGTNSEVGGSSSKVINLSCFDVLPLSDDENGDSNKAIPGPSLKFREIVPKQTGNEAIEAVDKPIRCESPLILNNLLPMPVELLDHPEFEEPIYLSNDDPEDNPVEQVDDPLRLDTEMCTSIPESEIGDFMATFTEANIPAVSKIAMEDLDGHDLDSDLADVETGIVKKGGYEGPDLFKCATCRLAFENSLAFKAHIVLCSKEDSGSSSRPFKCIHCVKNFKWASSLVDHLRYHGTPRFGCSLCEFKHSHQMQVRSHMKVRHKIANVKVIPVDPKKADIDKDEFVMRPKMVKRKDSSEGVLVAPKDVAATATTDESKVEAVAKSYGPDEVNLLPRQAIYNLAIKCAVCSYNTKVRTNMMRHLLAHSEEKSVPEIAPVNPVPCLEKNEKMFDKMTNLAMSSFTGAIRMGSKMERRTLSKEEESRLPAFVPSTKRYVCGASNCSYLCLEESMLRHHLLALHTDESMYKCKHCDEILNSEKGAINVDVVMKHFRLHELHLYKCGHCKFFHNLRHKVERHLTDRHADESPVLVVVREIDAEPEDHGQDRDEISTELKELKPWRCGMCKYRCATRNEVFAHANNKHDLDCQFKCALCSYKDSAKEAFTSHFEEKHAGQEVDVIDVFYKVEAVTASKSDAAEESHFDTTPLWQRDRPRIRHIRGILFDESGKVPKKSPLKLVDKSIEAVVNGSGTPGSDKKESLLLPKSLTLKKYKSAKQRKLENEIIEIEDDPEPLFVSVDSTSAAVKDKAIGATADKAEGSKDAQEEEVDIISVDEEEKMVSSKGKETTLDYILSLDKAAVGELVGEYGPFGKPFNKQYLCPLCSKFKTKNTKDITHHLYKELDYARFVCTHCGLMGITYEFLRRHSAKKHVEGKPEAIHPLPVDSKIEKWVEQLLMVQHNLMQHNQAPVANPPVVEDLPDKFVEDDTSNKNNASLIVIEEVAEVPTAANAQLNLFKFKMHQCSYCAYKCKAASDLRKHEKRHWVQKPLKCGYCGVEGVTNYEIVQHSKKVHRNLEPKIVTLPIPAIPTIKPISRKRKRTNSIVELSAESPAEKKIGEDTVVDLIESSESEEPILIVCNFCPKRCENVLEMRIHWENAHETKGYEFKYKRMPKSEIRRRRPSVFMCFSCELTGPMDVLQAHHKIAHPLYPFYPYRYRCGVCNDVIRSLGKMKVHFAETHKGVQIKYKNMVEMPAKPKPVKRSAPEVPKEVPNKVIVVDSPDSDDDLLVVQQVNVAKKSTTQFSSVRQKPTARKSTTYVEGYSHYGTRPDNSDHKNISTTVPIMGSSITMYVEQLSHFFDLFPVVMVVDCVKHKH